MRRRPWLLRTTLLAGLIVLVVALTLLRAAKYDALTTLHHDIANFRETGTAIRLLLIIALAVFWSRIVTAAETRGAIHKTAALVLHDARWRLLAWLIAAELLIGVDIATVVVTRVAA